MEKFSKSIILFSFAAITLISTGCPEFSSIRYPRTVFTGDTLKVQIEVELYDNTYSNGNEFGVRVPKGWRIADSVIHVDGLLNPDITLNQKRSDVVGSWRYWLVDSMVSSTLTTEYVFVNELDSSAVSEFTIFMWDGWDNFFSDFKRIRVATTDNPRIPTKLMYSDNLLTWKAPRKTVGLTGFNVYRNGKLYARTLTNESKIIFKPGINTFSVSANYDYISEYHGQDTIRVHMGNELYVSNEGSDDNNGSIHSPLKTIEFAMENIEYNYLVNEEKVIHLMEGTYDHFPKLWRDGVSLSGAGPDKTIFEISEEENLFKALKIKKGFQISDLTIVSETSDIMTIGDDYFCPNSAKVRLTNLHLFNSRNAQIGVRSWLKNLTLDHVLISGMDSAGMHGEFTRIVHSNIVDNSLAIQTNRGHSTILNSILYGNRYGSIDTTFLNYFGDTESTTLFISNSILDEQWIHMGPNNMTDDPLFIEDANYPYLLDPSSPAVDAAIDSTHYRDQSDPFDRRLAKFPAQGTILGDLGIYGGLSDGNVIVSVEKSDIVRKLNIYPNPAESTVYFDIPNGTSTAQLQITDMWGRNELHIIEGNRFEISGFAPGIYIISVEVNGILYQDRIVKH